MTHSYLFLKKCTGLLFIFILGSFFVGVAQNVGVNTTGASPASTNMFEALQPSTTANSVGVYASHSGAVAGGGNYGYALQAIKSGAGVNNIAAYLSSTGGTNNYALIVPSGGGNVGIGTTAPAQLLDIRGNLTIGDGTSYGDSRISIAGTGSNNDAAISMHKSDGTTNPIFSILPWDSQVYLSAGIYFSNNAWVHHSDGADNQLFLMDPGNGVGWYASNNSTGSWNVSSNRQLWDDNAYWKSLIQSTRAGDSYFTGGNVGIGVTSPLQSLHASGSIQTDARYLYLGADQYLYGDNSSALYYNNNHSTVTQMIFRDKESTQYGRVYGSGDGANFGLLDGDGNWSYLAVKDNYTALYINNAELVRLKSDGNLGIGTTSPTYKLHVSGKIKTDDITESSDFRWKKNIVPVTSALSKVNAMRGVYFNWRTDEFPEHQFDTTLQVGVIAQEMEKVLPEVVSTDSEGWKSVEYSKLVPVLIEAIKEQQITISKLQDQNSRFSSQNKQFESRINKLEQLLKAETKK